MGSRCRVGECVFCTRRDQPEALLEGRFVYVMPDKFPLVPGHTLIITRAHLPCYGAAADEVLQELEATVATVHAFLRHAYGGHMQVWENGVAGQTVLHAHLHLLPTRQGLVPPELVAHADVSPAVGWDAVRAHYGRHGCYRYAGFGPERYLIAGHSPVLAVLRSCWQRGLGLRWDGRDWVRTTTPHDVREVHRRWAQWQAGPEAAAGLTWRA